MLGLRSRAQALGPHGLEDLLHRPPLLHRLPLPRYVIHIKVGGKVHLVCPRGRGIQADPAYLDAVQGDGVGAVLPGVTR